jgi:hypothetical protein
MPRPSHVPVNIIYCISGCMWRCTDAVCVLESDFGFKLNCAFKKSGLFRVRNLGGVKGYIGAGTSFLWPVCYRTTRVWAPLHAVLVLAQ